MASDLAASQKMKVIKSFRYPGNGTNVTNSVELKCI